MLGQLIFPILMFAFGFVVGNTAEKKYIPTSDGGTKGLIRSDKPESLIVDGGPKSAILRQVADGGKKVLFDKVADAGATSSASHN